MELYLEEEKPEIPNCFDQHFTFIKKIGSGSFGTVVHAINHETDKEVAVKIINKKNQKNLIYLKQEITIFQQLKHKGIVEFINYIETDQKFYIVMEYIRSGTLEGLINERVKNNELFTEIEVATIIKSILDAVEYIHTREIVHRDIKPENLLVHDSSDFSTIKIIDFGLSAQYFEQNEEFELCGTAIYMAPEQIGKKIYTKAIDIWSIGIIMYRLLHAGKHPFWDKGDSMKVYKERIRELKQENIMLDEKFSYMANNMFTRLLNLNPVYRYPADQALKHPFITRDKHAEIPLTYLENWKQREFLGKFRKLALASIFLSNFSNKENKDNKEQSDEWDNMENSNLNDTTKLSLTEQNYVEKCNTESIANNKYHFARRERCFDYNRKISYEQFKYEEVELDKGKKIIKSPSMILLKNVPQHTVGDLPEFLGGVRKLIKTTYRFNETSLKMKPIMFNSSKNGNANTNASSTSNSPVKLKMVHNRRSEQCIRIPITDKEDKKYTEYYQEDLIKTSNKINDKKIVEVREFDLVARNNNRVNKKNISLSPVKKFMKTNTDTEYGGQNGTACGTANNTTVSSEHKLTYTRRQSFNETQMMHASLGLIGRHSRNNNIVKNVSTIFPRESDHSISPSKKHYEDAMTLDNTNTHNTTRTKLSSLSSNIRKSRKSLALVNFTKLPSLGNSNITPKKEISNDTKAYKKSSIDRDRYEKFKKNEFIVFE